MVIFHSYIIHVYRLFIDYPYINHISTIYLPSKSRINHISSYINIYQPYIYHLCQSLPEGPHGYPAPSPAQDPATGRHLPLLCPRLPRCLALGPGAAGADGGTSGGAQRGSWATGRGRGGNCDGILVGFWSDFGRILMGF